MQMWKGEDGMDIASYVEDDNDNEEGEGEDKEMPSKSKTKCAPPPSCSRLRTLATLESNQLLHLQLRKRYYAEVANFMWMVEGAMCVFFYSFLISPCFLTHSHCFPPIKK